MFPAFWSSSVAASYLSGCRRQKVFDSGGALTVVVFYRLILHPSGFTHQPQLQERPIPRELRCPRALPPSATAVELAAAVIAGIALDSDAATRASLWIGCALATWTRSLLGHQAPASTSGAGPPLSQPPLDLRLAECTLRFLQCVIGHSRILLRCRDEFLRRERGPAPPPPNLNPPTPPPPPPPASRACCCTPRGCAASARGPIMH